MDAQWHNLRAVVFAIKVDLIVSVQQPKAKYPVYMFRYIIIIFIFCLSFI